MKKFFIASFLTVMLLLVCNPYASAVLVNISVSGEFTPVRIEARSFSLEMQVDSDIPGVFHDTDYYQYWSWDTPPASFYVDGVAVGEASTLILGHEFADPDIDYLAIYGSSQDYYGFSITGALPGYTLGPIGTDLTLFQSIAPDDFVATQVYLGDEDWPFAHSQNNASISMSSVPEPATIFLLGAGLVGLAGFGLKRFKK